MTEENDGDAGKNLRALTRIVNEFRTVESDLAMSYAAVFLYVARHEQENRDAPSISDISDNIGLVSPTVSRSCKALGDQRVGAGRVGETKSAGSRMALKLFEKVPDPEDLRVTRWKLSAKGRGLLARLQDHL